MGSTLFRRVRVFDGTQLLDATDVLVRDGRIAEVGRRAVRAAAQGSEVVDGQGRQTLLPGLIDAHAHIVEGALARALRFGVTTELDMANPPALIRAAKAAHEDPETPPTADVRSAGAAATVPGGHGTQFFPGVPTLRSPAEAAGFVADRIAEGSDYLKIHYADGVPRGRDPVPVLDPPTVAALAGAAHERGLLAVAHVGTLAAAVEALTAGVDGLAHVFADAQPADPDTGPIAEFAALAAERHAFLIPTLTMIDMYAGGKGICELADDPALAPHLSDEDIETLDRQRSGANPALPLYPESAATGVRAAAAAGVPILAGTDMVFALHGAALHRELELLVGAGLSTAQALAAATATPARAFGLDDRGRIAPGLRADLLLVDGDPLADIRCTRAIAGVWQRGAQVSARPVPAR
ncbi:amidohydrolase family protein [Micromonospora sp. CPCC 205371]|nr:amidohydrolase family protein [Micromonospora sp. CPCC 205371]